MVVVVGKLVEYKLAMYGNYIFCGAIFVSSILMGKVLYQVTHLTFNIFAVFVRPTLRRVKIENTYNVVAVN